jgi:hypothetical protein
MRGGAVKFYLGFASIVHTECLRATKNSSAAWVDLER